MDDARKTNAQLLQNRALLSRRRARLEAAPRDTPAPGQRPLAHRRCTRLKRLR